MKGILKENIEQYIIALKSRFQVTDDIDAMLFEKLYNFYLHKSDAISADDTEKSIACIYFMQKYGVPLKSTMRYLEIDQHIVFKQFKYLKKPTYYYIGNFINYLTRYDDKPFKDRFIALFEKTRQKSSDQFLMAIAIKVFMKKEPYKNNGFDYPPVSIAKNIKLIREII